MRRWVAQLLGTVSFGRSLLVLAMALSLLPLNPVVAVAADLTISTVDAAADVGTWSSAAIGHDGLGLVAYYDSLNDDLKVAHCDDPACSSATNYVIDSVGNVGQYASLTIGVDGLGLISYYDATNANLKVAHCDNTQCSSASASTLDSSGTVGQYTSVAIGPDGFGRISYYKPTGQDLKVANCNNVTCSTASTSVVDSTGTIGQWSSLTIGTDGFALVSYYDTTNTNLKVAHCSNASCSSSTRYNIDSAGTVGEYSSITLGTDGLALISYYDRTNTNLKVAHCTNALCSTSTTQTVDSSGSVGQYTSVAITANGFGAISYFSATGSDLKLARCSDLQCSSTSNQTVDTTGTVGQYSSINIDGSGFGLAFYFLATSSDLKVAHCGTSCGFAVLEPPALWVSASADRSNPMPLEAAPLTGEAYVFLQSSDPRILGVSFWLDDPAMAGPAFTVDAIAPWDLVGGDPGLALPFDTTSLSDGPHVVTARIDYGLQQVATVSSSFTVSNAPIVPDLMISSSADRSEAVPLEGETIYGDVAVFASVSTTDVEQAAFYIDDPSMAGSPYSVDTDPPYDLNGSVSTHPAAPAVMFASNTLAEGEHTVTVEIEMADPMDNVVATAEFAVDNTRIITLDGPMQGATLFGIESLTASVDEVVASVDFLMDGNVIASDSSQPYLVDWDTATAGDGDHVLSARANLVGGGSVDSIPAGVAVDNSLSASARVSEDYERGLITPDEHALWGLYSLSNTTLLSERYDSTIGEDGGTSLALGFLSEWDTLQQATRDEIEAFASITEELAAPGPPGPGAAAFPDCYRQSVDLVWISIAHAKPLRCKTNLGRWTFFYTLDSFGAADGVEEIDTNQNHIPDHVDAVRASLDAAWTVYETLQYDMPDWSPSSPIEVVIHNTRGMVLPDYLNIGGPPRIQLNPISQNYLPRHELFHRVQYEYFSPSSLEGAWWMEASAEWATHQASGFAGDPAPFAYANAIGDFMSRPSEHIATFDLPLLSSESRHYGAFVLAEFLEEREGLDAVRQTWLAIQSGATPLAAISGVLGGLQDELSLFARSNYLLDSWNGSDPYLDGDVDAWRDVLDTGETAGNAQGGARPARQSVEFTDFFETQVGWNNLEYGGSAYVDLVPPVNQQGYMIVQVDNLDEVDYELVAFDDYPSLCQEPIAIPEGSDGRAAVELGNGCEFATLIATSVTQGTTVPAPWVALFVEASFPETELIGAVNYLGGTTHTVNYLPRNTGDLLFAYVTYKAWSGPSTVSLPPDWTVLGETPPASTRSVLMYKVAESESWETADFPTPSSTRMAIHVFEVSNWGGEVPAISAPNLGFGSSPDPLPVSATWGTDANLFLAFVGVGDAFAWATPPVGYEMEMFADANVGVSHGFASRTAFSASDDPGPFTTTSDPWTTFTMVIQGSSEN